MIWNRIKKIVNRKGGAKADNSSSLSANTAELVLKKIPMSFLKRLIPIGELPEDELRQFKTHISSHQPGDVIFKLKQKSNSLPYLIKGKCYVEASNGSGYEVNAATFKALYPLSNSAQYQCSAIAKSDVIILHLPSQALIKSNQHLKPRRSPNYK